MEKIVFANAIQTTPATVNMGGNNYNVTPAIITGGILPTPDNMNLLQDNIENAIAGAGGSTSGTNENGSWVKYSDGRMECYGTKELSFSATERAEIGCDGGINLGNFSQEFIEPPTLIMHAIKCYSNAYSYIHFYLFPNDSDPTTLSLGQAKIRSEVRVGSTDGGVVKISYHALGRWQ